MNDEDRKLVSESEGYELVILPQVYVWFSLFLCVILICVIAWFVHFYGSEIMYWVCCVVALLIEWIVMHKLFETRVNIKLTDKGLVQTRISGSRQVPECRIVEWENMKSYRTGQNAGWADLYVTTRSGKNYGVKVCYFCLFEKKQVEFFEVL